jgi:PAS domain S-box-containing protein
VEQGKGRSRGASAPHGEELLRLVLESATDYAIFTTDPNGIVTSWNPGAKHLLGWRDDEIVGHSCDVIFLPEEG